MAMKEEKVVAWESKKDQVLLTFTGETKKICQLSICLEQRLLLYFFGIRFVSHVQYTKTNDPNNG